MAKTGTAINGSLVPPVGQMEHDSNDFVENDYQYISGNFSVIYEIFSPYFKMCFRQQT